MKRLCLLGVVSLFTGMSVPTLSGGQDRDVKGSVTDRFVGVWRLAWLEEEGADGKLRPGATLGRPDRGNSPG